MFERIREDLKTIFERDPAAHSKLEVALCYPGFHALIMHRWAYWCNLQGWPTFARWVSHAARFLTGVEIHPAAKNRAPRLYRPWYGRGDRGDRGGGR